MVVHPRMCTSGALGKYAYSDPRTALGREYLDLQLSTIIADDSKIQDLAITGRTLTWTSSNNSKCLEATHHEPDIMPLAGKQIKLWLGPRGHPENVGGKFEATHPLVVTNPVTGWKALWSFSLISMRANGRINSVTPYENEVMKAYFLKLITDNHDLQYRHWWKPDDIVIWDNRTVLHAGTYDLTNEERLGYRITSLTGKFYSDPTSLLREEDLRKERMANSST